mgnify:CR=1 FL=1
MNTTVVHLEDVIWWWLLLFFHEIHNLGPNGDKTEGSFFTGITKNDFEWIFFDCDDWGESTTTTSRNGGLGQREDDCAPNHKTIYGALAIDTESCWEIEWDLRKHRLSQSYRSIPENDYVWRRTRGQEH